MSVERDSELDDNDQAYKQGFDRGFEAPRSAAGGAVGTMELMLGAFALAAWFIFFAGGILVSTTPYRAALANTTTLLEWLRYFAVIVLCWTITNVGILSCVAAFLGAVGRRTRFTVQAMQDDHADLATAHMHDVAVFYLSAVMRGFGIFSLSFAGLLLLATDAFIDPEQSGYLRLAATLSVISFYAGYDPETFAGLLERVKKFFEGK